MNTTNAKDVKKFLDFTYNVRDIVEKEKWVLRYDLETDSLSCRVSKLPDDARIKYFGDEFAFYMTKDNKIKGIFIEYFSSNFIKHHKEAKDFKIALDTKKKELKLKNSDNNLISLRRNKRIISELAEAMQMAFASRLTTVL